MPCRLIPIRAVYWPVLVMTASVYCGTHKTHLNKLSSDLSPLESPSSSTNKTTQKYLELFFQTVNIRVIQNCTHTGLGHTDDNNSFLCSFCVVIKTDQGYNEYSSIG